MFVTLSASPARQAAAVVFIVALATLAAAWAFELIGGYIPCQLCLQERLPYYAGLLIVAAAMAGALLGLPETILRALMGLTALVFLAGFTLGTYHMGVEYGWWLGPSDCGGGAPSAVMSAENLLQQLEGVRVVSCSEASWRFPAGWGLSFAGWNAAASAFLTVVAALGALANRSPAQPA